MPKILDMGGGTKGLMAGGTEGFLDGGGDRPPWGGPPHT